MIQRIRQWFCKHEYKHYGREVGFQQFHGSECRKCGKIRVRL